MHFTREGVSHVDVGIPLRAESEALQASHDWGKQRNKLSGSWAAGCISMETRSQDNTYMKEQTAAACVISR